jgi:phosphoribosylformylglycinamidine synthase
MKARVFITLKPSVFDPQGRTIAEALHSLGYTDIGDVRQGKFFELDVAAASAEQARTLASEVADKVLANPVIESYRVEVEHASAGGEPPQATAGAQRSGDGARGPTERRNE